MVHHQIFVGDEFSGNDSLTAAGCRFVHPGEDLVVALRDDYKALLVRAAQGADIYECAVVLVALKIQSGDIWAELILFPLVVALSDNTPGNTEHDSGRVVAEVAPSAGVRVEGNVGILVILIPVNLFSRSKSTDYT